MNEIKEERKSINDCPRCGKIAFIDNKFCSNCQQKFDTMVEELRLAYIHQRNHPEKRLLYIHIVEEDIEI